jgi:hypothetical protein
MSAFLARRVESLRCEGSEAIGAKRTCRERGSGSMKNGLLPADWGGDLGDIQGRFGE